MDVSNVKEMAQGAKETAQSWLSDEGPVRRAQSTLHDADAALRRLAKEQPMVAVGAAVIAGYLVGRAVARVS